MRVAGREGRRTEPRMGCHEIGVGVKMENEGAGEKKSGLGWGAKEKGKKLEPRRE